MSFRILPAPNAYPGKVGQFIARDIPNEIVVEQNLRLIAENFRIV